MIYKNLHAILASRLDGLIGDGDTIPWHHSGDLKYFKERTKDAALIIGFKTLEGIAKNYFKNGKEVLPGRKLFVYYKDRPEEDAQTRLALAGNFNWKNVFQLKDRGDPEFELKCIMAHEGAKGNVFIAGGSKTYERYIKYASDVYLTVIRQANRLTYDHPVYLSKAMQDMLFQQYYNHSIQTIQHEQTEGNTTAEFLRLYKSLGDFHVAGDGSFVEF